MIFFIYLTLIEIVLELKYEYKIGWIKYLGLQEFDFWIFGIDFESLGWRGNWINY